MTSDDEALRQLRDADPARGSRPDPWQLRSAVDRAIADDRAADEVSWEGRTMGRLGRGTAYLAAACVAALTVGVGGYALGQSRAGDDVEQAVGSVDGGDAGTDSAGGGQDAESARGPESIVGSSDNEFGWMSRGDSYRSFAVGEMPTATGEAVRLVPGDGLSTDIGAPAEVLQQQAPRLDVEAELLEIAERMGISGTISGEDDWRTVRQAGRSVSSFRAPGSLNLSYDSVYLNPGCIELVQEMVTWPDEAKGDEGGSRLHPDKCLPDPSQSLSEPEALAIGQQLASAFGVDPEDLTFTVYDDPGAQTWGAATSTDAEGPHIQLDYSLRAEGVMSAHLVLREGVSLGSYPVISPAEAVERANDPVLGRLPILPDGVSEQEWSSSRQTWSDTARVEAGAPIPVPGQVATVTSATLSTGMLVDGGGGAYTVPIYLLTTDDGNRFAVIALAQEALSLPQ